jgi:probable F420-dependent oxidoreductase
VLESPPVQIGAFVPNSGPLPLEPGIPTMATRLEEAGFSSLWVSDHIVFPETTDSAYPFAADRRPTWSFEIPYFDALVSLALIAAVTEKVTIGTSVLVLPLRHPVAFAKQAASIDVASGGRLRVGVGAGWLREEFDALNVPFEDRGGRLVEWLEIARDCWTGRPRAHASDRYTLPPGVLCLPKPVREIPLLMGGHSPAALRRAGRHTGGWLAQQSLDGLDPAELRAGAAAMREAAAAAGRDADACELVLRLVDSGGRADEVAAAIPGLADAGVDEIIVNVDWEADLGEQYARIAA